MEPRRILITGGTGLLGKALLETVPADCEAFATSYRNEPPPVWRDRFHRLDVRDDVSVFRLMERVRPSVVIHTASIGSVDEAEHDPERVAEVNVGGTRIVAEACAKCGSALVYVSSNAVFDGAHPPYDEKAPRRAVNRYGELKIEAEDCVRRTLDSSVIIRPILMYGWPLAGGRDNVVTRWLALLDAGMPVAVSEELFTQPLLVENGAEAVWAAVVRQRRGTYHVAGADRISLLEFARRVARVFGLEQQLIHPASAQALERFAPRPRDTSFVTTRMERELGVRPVGVLEGLSNLQRTRVCGAPTPSR